MKAWLTRGILVWFVIGAGACAHLDTVSVTQIPKERNKKVRAESERWIIFGFNFDNDYVEEIVRGLKRKCKGRVQGILTKDETYSYFLWFVRKKRVSASGYCARA